MLDCAVPVTTTVMQSRVMIGLPASFLEGILHERTMDESTARAGALGREGEPGVGGDTLLYNRVMKRHVLIFGLIGGLLIATQHYTEYRFVVIEHSIELYGALVAVLFAAFGIWLGRRITRGRETVRETIRETVVVREVLVPAEGAAPFVPNKVQQRILGITARELEILTLVARGFSNREIATQLFVSENTVKTHCARAFDKLGAARRTQAVLRGKELGLLP